MRIVVRVRRLRSRLGRFVGVSLGVHVAAVAAMFFVPFLRPKAESIPVDATFVELSGAITAPSAARAAPRTAAPAPPPKAAEPEGAHAVEKIPPPTKKKPEKKPKDEPRPSQRPAPPGPVAPPGPEPAGPPTGTAAGPAGITSLEAADPSLAWYNSAVAGALENAWVKPLLEGVDSVQSVVVEFEIGRDGNVFNLRVDVPSGIASLDRSALRAVQDAAPFPVPPPGSPGAGVRQRIRFDLRPESR